VKRMECHYCKGVMARGKTTYTISRHGYHLLIHDVPAWICQQCGETYFEGKEVDIIQDMIRTLDSKIAKAQVIKSM